MAVSRFKRSASIALAAAAVLFAAGAAQAQYSGDSLTSMTDYYNRVNQEAFERGQEQMRVQQQLDEQRRQLDYLQTQQRWQQDTQPFGYR